MPIISNSCMDNYVSTIQFLIDRRVDISNYIVASLIKKSYFGKSKQIDNHICILLLCVYCFVLVFVFIAHTKATERNCEKKIFFSGHFVSRIDVRTYPLITAVASLQPSINNLISVRTVYTIYIILICLNNKIIEFPMQHNKYFIVNSLRLLF